MPCLLNIVSAFFLFSKHPRSTMDQEFQSSLPYTRSKSRSIAGDHSIHFEVGCGIGILDRMNVEEKGPFSLFPQAKGIGTCSKTGVFTFFDLHRLGKFPARLENCVPCDIQLFPAKNSSFK